MAYEKQTWTNGDIITADKLNHMEGGIADTCDCYITVTYNTESPSISCDKTYAELCEMITNKIPVRMIFEVYPPGTAPTPGQIPAAAGTEFLEHSFGKISISPRALDGSILQNMGNEWVIVPKN